MQHIEFFHIDHFENNYFRTPPPAALAHFIDFFWETRFDYLWQEYPGGFSDAQFANIGYTYIINLGTPCTMQVDEKKFHLRTDGFLPRYHAIECFHKPGNHLFGIKFRITPVILQKKVNFSEYRHYIFPLSYLLDQAVVNGARTARSFDERTNLMSRYFLKMLAVYDGSLTPVNIVSRVLDHAFQQNDFNISIEEEARQNKISSRTLQRYFEACTGISSKKALQVMRIRKAVAHLANSPSDFDFTAYGYYDHSHFCKHLRQFLAKNTLKNVQPHLKLLEGLHGR